jgi:hypothetical protein
LIASIPVSFLESKGSHRNGKPKILASLIACLGHISRIGLKAQKLEKEAAKQVKRAARALKS